MNSVLKRLLSTEVAEDFSLLADKAAPGLSGRFGHGALSVERWHCESLCAGHAQQLGGESPPANLMEVIVSRRRESVMLYER